jgi:tetratricopeptide (TPR) repeat protein
VELFVRCVRKLRQDYVLTSSEAPHVAGIVRLLDGIPLALCLAAPRMVVMNARALLHRLRTNLDSLMQGGHGRHSTLDAAIEASWNAMEPWEQRALCQCTVFRGGFSTEAAEAVIDLRGLTGAPAILDVLQSLRDKSMLRACTSCIAPDELRLEMYRAVRQYASRRFERIEATDAESRHADWFVAWGERWSADASPAAGGVLVERDNLLAVVDRVAAHQPVTARTAEPALRALLVLSGVAQLHGPMQTWMRVLDPTLEATRDSGADPMLVGRALSLRGALHRARGNPRAASRDLLHAVGTARSLRADCLEAEATLELAQLFADRGDGDESRRHHDKAMELWRSCGALGQEARAMASLGRLLAREGRVEQALPLLERAVAVHESHLNPIALALDHRWLAEVLIDVARLREAREHLAASAAHCRETGDFAGEAIATGMVGLIEHDSGQLAAADRTWGEAIGAMREFGLVPVVGLFTGYLGVLRREQGRGAEAYTLLRQAIDLVGEEGDALKLSLFLVHLAALDGEARRADDAAGSLRRATALAASLHAPCVGALCQLQSKLEEGSDASQERACACEVAHSSVSVRIALRCEQRARGATLVPPPDDALVVAAAAQWFRAPHGECVSLERRRPLARILDRLIRERLDHPGHPLSWEVVLAAAWPGERVIASAGAHRVRVAVSTLRKLGLRELIQTVEDGYVLTLDCKAVQLDG